MYLPRFLEKEVEETLKRGVIAIVKGPRQVGKTTLLKRLQEKHGGTYIDLTDETWAKRMEEDPLSLLSLEEPLFLDEISMVKNAGRALKLLYDKKKIKIVVSGSGAFEIKENIGGYLVGRASYLEMFPLSFDEYVLWKDKKLYEWYKDIKTKIWKAIEGKAKFSKVPEIKKLKSYYEEYSRYGGYPEVVLKEDKEKRLRDLIETQLEKDIFSFFDIREKEKFKEVIKRLSLNTGELLNIGNLGVSYETAWNYINCLIMEYILNLLPSFHKNMKTELRKMKKVYFYDMGIVNTLANFRLSIGQERENFAFISLSHKAAELNVNLYYWRTQGGAEVDFLLTKRDKAFLPIEIKTSAKRSKGLWSVMDSYKLKRGIIISDENKTIKKNGNEITYLEPWWI